MKIITENKFWLKNEKNYSHFHIKFLVAFQMVVDERVRRLFSVRVKTKNGLSHCGLGTYWSWLAGLLQCILGEAQT